MRIGAAEEEAFLVGDGVKKLTGVFTKVTASADGLTKVDKAAKSPLMISWTSFIPFCSVYRNRAQFILNDTTVKALRKIQDNNGNYIWQPSVVVGQPGHDFESSL